MNPGDNPADFVNPNLLGQNFGNINTLGFILIFILSIMIIVLPRRYAIIPILAGVFYVSLGQIVNIFGLHFTSMRILVLIGYIRVIIRRELTLILLSKIDKAIILFVLVSFIVYIFLWKTKEAFIYQSGVSYNILGIYFLCRVLVRDIEDIVGIVRIMAFAIIPLTILMVLEKMSGRNIFSYFGAVPPYTWIRDGHLRCQGPFTHPILAGTFGVTFAPMFIGLWFNGGKDKIISLLGFISSSLITFLCYSSGPLIAYIFLIIGYLFWFFRNNMKIVRWFILLTVVTLHMIMKAPVYHLIGRVGEITGGTGYHRVTIVNSAIKYFQEWWIIGTTSTAHWSHYTLPNDPNSSDITNQYIFVGVQGGIISIILFLAIIVKCFGVIGIIRKHFENQSSWYAIFVWSVGVSLFTYVVSFISMAMFDFIPMYYYIIISFIGIYSEYLVVNNINMANEI